MSDKKEKQKKLPYFFSLFQGKNFAINAKVNSLRNDPTAAAGYIEILWIKLHKKEWTVNLDKQTIEYKNGADKCITRKSKHKIFPLSSGDGKINHTTFVIPTIFGNIRAQSYCRRVLPVFNKRFFREYKNFDECVGALISEEKLIFLPELKTLKIAKGN